VTRDPWRPAVAKARGFVVQPTYRVRNGRPVVQLFGRLETGEAFLVEEHRFRPYFFVPTGQEQPLRGDPAVQVEPTGLRDLRGRPVVRVVAEIPAAIPLLRSRVEQAGGETLEADVRFPYRFLIDRGLRATLSIDGPAEEAADGLLRFVDPELAPATARPVLRTLSLDLETSPDASRLYSAALAGCGTEEVHILSAEPVAGGVCHRDERALLQALIERIRALDPDVLLGWNVVDFDLRVLARRCQSSGVRFAIGRTPEPPRFLRDASFSRSSRVEVPGRMVLDGIDLVREALRLPDYRLETVARSVLGRGKKIDGAARDAAAEITRMFREDPAALVAYNLEDARLVPEILEREGLLALAVERSRLTGMQLDRVGASIASFDLLYLPELRRRGFVAPSVDPDRKGAVVHGGALLDPVPGLHARVAVMDFKSLYPSLMRTFRLDPLAHARADQDPDPIVAPNGARFARGDAILPTAIEQFLERRGRAKREGNRHGDQAIKIMMNALFGVLGAPSCRFFDPDVANAITSFGQQTLRWTRDAFERAGVTVLYGDTDSVFVRVPDPEVSAEPRGLAEALRESIETDIAGRIRRDYRVEPHLSLELQRVFDRFLLPRVRGGRSGSKKRYAGLDGDHLVLVGLESVRRDWPEVAQRLQRGMLERLFADQPLGPFVKDLVERVRRGELDGELVYAKRVRKGSLDRSTAATPPHVQAARKAGTRPGGVVRYVVTAHGPEPVLPGRPLPLRIDRSYYVERVLRPVAESILCESGSSFDEALGKPRQLSLL
jgi:DNA polymerase-2